LRKSHANSRFYWHFRSSVYSQFDKPGFFPINCLKLSIFSPFGSSIFRAAESMLFFAQSLRLDRHIKRRGRRIASSDEASILDEHWTLFLNLGGNYRVIGVPFKYPSSSDYRMDLRDVGRNGSIQSSFSGRR
jgi:hypothetical protein